MRLSSAPATRRRSRSCPTTSHQTRACGTSTPTRPSMARTSSLLAGRVPIRAASRSAPRCSHATRRCRFVGALAAMMLVGASNHRAGAAPLVTICILSPQASRRPVLTSADSPHAPRQWAGKLTLPADYEKLALEEAEKERQFFHLTPELNALVDYHSFMEALAREVSCAPPPRRPAHIPPPRRPAHQLHRRSATHKLPTPSHRNTRSPRPH